MSILNFSHLKNLNEKQKAELQRILTKLQGFTKSCKSDIVDLEGNLLAILRNSLKELSKIEDIDAEKIEELFNKTVKISLEASREALEKAYNEQLKTKDIFLFDGIVIEKCLNVLEKILKFQKELDEIYPGASKKIIKSLENILVGVIATQIPPLATVIELSGVLEKVNNLIDHEKLLPKVTKWHDDIKKVRKEVKNDKNLENIYERAEEVAKLSEISHKSVKEVIEVEKNPNNKSSLDNVIEAAKAIPKDKAEVEEKISELKNNIEKGIPKNIKLDNIKAKLNSLDEVKKELSKVINPETSFADKISSLCKAAEQATKVASDVKKIVEALPGGKSLTGTLDFAIKSNIQVILPPPIRAIVKLAPEVANLVKVGKAVIMLLNKSQDLKQNQGRSKSV